MIPECIMRAFYTQFARIHTTRCDCTAHHPVITQSLKMVSPASYYAIATN